MSDALLSQIDSVYMFMFAGFASELRSNRWHFAKRWARHRPVVLIQPDRLTGPRAVARPEPRIPGCSLLSVRTPSTREFWSSSMRVMSELAVHMKEAGHRRPLFWLYNPYLALPFAGLPAVLRVQHATENYFQMRTAEGGQRLEDMLVASARASDHVIAVSTGVADATRQHVPEASVWVRSNGVDLESYARWRPSPRVAALRAGFDKLAIYAGNINGRLDFDLIDAAVARLPRTRFVFVGPVVGLTAAAQARWAAVLQAPNVVHLGPADPDELPDLYGAADVGFIPYDRSPFIEDNGFPLKTLEMAATELPVVSTYMRPLEEIEAAIHLARDHESFIAGLASAARAQLPPAQRAAMAEVCRAKDYDRSFEAIVARLSDGATGRVSTQLDAVTPFMSDEVRLEMFARLLEPCSTSIERCTRMGARAVGLRAWKKLPGAVRAAVDDPFPPLPEE